MEWYPGEKSEFHVEDWEFMEMAGWASSGGATFQDFNDRLHGKKLPARQRHQGDQWSNVIVRHPYPFGVVLSMGSNDVGNMYRALMKMRLDDKKRGVTGTETRWFRWAFKTLTKNAKENVVYMKKAYPKAKFFFVSIINRPGWPKVVCRLAKWIGDYMRNELGFVLIDVSNHIKRYHILERDLVHLNRIGYHRFYTAVARPISTVYMQWKTAQMKQLKGKMSK